uniref:Uncharacterized protein n=1 Tax=Brassica oleracea var. oleracea TaxID=109376 RepID=A0A0D3BIC9_BRAOL
TVQLERLLSGFCRANVLWNLSLPRRIQITSKRRLSFSTGVHNVIEFLSDDSPDMDVIGISGEFLLLYRSIQITCQQHSV